MPKVTVVIPNYNHARFLAQRIESVLNQTYTDFEVLYLDDASTDESAEVFAHYASDPRIRSLINSQNSGGPFPQWNRGVREAQTEYVWIAEADDYADVWLLERLVPILEANPEVGLAYSQSQYVDENGVLGGSAASQQEPERWTQDFITDGKEECARYLLFGNTIPNASAVVFRKSVYLASGGADETMQLCGDWYLWARMLLRSDIAFVAETLNYFRQHERSVSKRTKTAVFVAEKYRLTQMIRENVSLSAEQLEQSCDGMASYWMYNTLNRPRTISFAECRKIYPLARAMDRKLGGRLARKIVSYYLWRLGVMDRLRAARNAGRPRSAEG